MENLGWEYQSLRMSFVRFYKVNLRDSFENKFVLERRLRKENIKLY